MLPGLTRTAAQPASMAVNTYFGRKRTSATTGMPDLRANRRRGAASSADGTATCTSSQPVAVSSTLGCSVASMSAVDVMVIDSTDTGATPPTGTVPTMIWGEVRPVATESGTLSLRGKGIPQSTVVNVPPLSEPARCRDVDACPRRCGVEAGQRLHRDPGDVLRDQPADGQ
ncbi:hypothetical protein AQJ67_40250 [Streptomyces caeruleatus]|uniref:Uncharacterized protein n=1 Tax=Streptomyces caeruleatus TaxID=661399 RepID=A0A117RIE7_9ACTN|nr:hypothetical protein AQJ67_40250 [Streptomyces caeruleatus]